MRSSVLCNLAHRVALLITSHWGMKMWYKMKKKKKKTDSNKDQELTPCFISPSACEYSAARHRGQCFMIRTGTRQANGFSSQIQYRIADFHSAFPSFIFCSISPPAIVHNPSAFHRQHFSVSQAPTINHCSLHRSADPMPIPPVPSHQFRSLLQLFTGSSSCQAPQWGLCCFLVVWSLRFSCIIKGWKMGPPTKPCVC